MSTRAQKLKPETCQIQFEHTDTFGGEANYAWVKRETFEFPVDVSDRTLLRRARAWAGLTKVRGRVSNFGDTLEIRPYGICQVIFITTVS
jgi:hypothetical protein